MFTIKNALSTLTVAAALTLTACASNTVSPQQYSGFLGDYSKLQEAQSPSGQPVMRWIDPSVKPGQYTSVMLDPTVFYPQAQPSTQVGAQVLNQIPSQFDQDLKNAISSSGMQLVSTPGPNTLRISPAITAVNTSNAPLAAYQYVPIALVVTGVATAAGEHDQSVTAMVEMKAADSQTGKVVAQAVRKGNGSDLPNTSAQLTLKDMQPALKTWANDLGTQLAKFK